MSERSNHIYSTTSEPDHSQEDSFHQHAKIYNTPHGHYNMDVVATLIELQMQRRIADNELNAIKINLEQSITASKEHFRVLENSVAEIKSMARDAMTVSVGLDGKNGLRGSLEHLTKEFSSLPRDIEFLKQTANHYLDMKSLLLRLFATSFAAIFLQFGGAVWYVSEQHVKQEIIREDLNKVLNYFQSRNGDKIDLKSVDR